MTDREKFLYSLECCIRKLKGERTCNECPYNDCLGCSVVLWHAIALLIGRETLEEMSGDGIQ